MKPARFLAAAPLALALVAAGPAASSHAPTAKPTTVKVVMTDYDFALSKQRLIHGKVVFRVVNTGEVVHDFKIAGKKTPIFTTGQSGALSVAFKKPGKYTFICTVPGHVAAGMKGVLTVR
jgi:plastocyanin